MSCKHIILCALLLVEANAWSYDDPSSWGKEYPYCNGLQQSPVNIDFNKVVRMRMPAFKIRDIKGQYMAKNNGHSVAITPIQTTNSIPNMPKITIGHGHYEIKEIHFHWGLNDTLGSEHTISNHRYPMEMHVVTFNTIYEDFKIAQKNRNGLLVLTFLWNHSHVSTNSGLNDIANILPLLKCPQDETIMPSTFTLQSLLNTNQVASYYKYYGSLTTPPCYEVVTFAIATDFLGISSSQLEAFRRVQTECINGEGISMAPNYRPLQPINDRYIFKTA